VDLLLVGVLVLVLDLILLVSDQVLYGKGGNLVVVEEEEEDADADESCFIFPPQFDSLF
jgi:hypothetical protein